MPTRFDTIDGLIEDVRGAAEKLRYQRDRPCGDEACAQATTMYNGLVFRARRTLGDAACGGFRLCDASFTRRFLAPCSGWNVQSEHIRISVQQLLLFLEEAASLRVYSAKTKHAAPPPAVGIGHEGPKLTARVRGREVPAS